MDPPTDWVLQRIHLLDASESTFPDQLNNLLCAQEYEESALSRGDHDVVWHVEYLDKVRRRTPFSPRCSTWPQVLDHLEPSGPVSQQYLRELRRLRGTGTVPPTSYSLA